MAREDFDEFQNPYETSYGTLSGDVSRARGGPIRVPTRSTYQDQVTAPYRPPAPASTSRDPYSVISPWLSRPYNATWLEDVLADLKQSGIAATRATRAGGVPSDDKIVLPNGQIVDLIEDVGGRNRLYYGPQSADPRRSDGIPGNARGGVTAGVAGQMFDDPATQMFQSLVLDRIDNLLKSVNRPEEEQYRAAALKRVDELMQPPYSEADEAALIARMRDPLTQARDTRIRENRERLGARNIVPGSGLFEEQVYNAPERDYERALAAGTNELAVRGIDERQRRRTQSLDTLADLVGLGRDTRAEDEGRSREALTTGAILPNLSERRLQLLMQSLGMSQGEIGSLMGNLTNLMGLNQNQAQFQAGQRQNNAYAMGQIFAQLLNSPLLNPSTWRT